MNGSTLKANLLLLLTAAIWGSAFVAQRAGMDHVGPFTFNGVRFALGGLSLLPLILLMPKPAPSTGRGDPRALFVGGSLAGAALYFGASLQQVGLVHTTAGKAGFITGLYVVIVPLMGLFWRQRPDLGTWTGAALAALGMYFLSVTRQFAISPGDFLVLIGAFFWAGHVLLLGWLSPRVDTLRLAMVQFLVCSLLSLGTAFAVETVALRGILDAALPILYGGLGSVGIAYTLQVVAQKDAQPSHAAIILSMESPFAALAGFFLLGEILGGRGMFGCTLMLAGMLLSQLYPYLTRRAAARRAATSL